MIFTLYYMYATFLQWWRLGTLKNKLNGTLNSQNSLLVCTGNVIYDNRKQRSIENLLFHNEDRIGCTIVPKQIINLSQWISFPKDLRCFPIFFTPCRQKIESPNMYILVQAILETYTKHHSNIIQMENFGELVAWKVSENFEAIIKTDVDKLTKLIHCFSQNDIDINHELKLLRIETVEVEGCATKIKYDKKYPLESTLKYSYNPVHWKKFVSDIKHLYAKIRDVTNPKITIENGTTKCDDIKKVPVSEVKPIKKNGKKTDDKNTLLDVSSSDYRRHKSSEHNRKDKSPNKPDKEQRTKDDHAKRNGKHEGGVVKEEKILPTKVKDEQKSKEHKSAKSTSSRTVEQKNKTDKVVAKSSKEKTKAAVAGPSGADQKTKEKVDCKAREKLSEKHKQKAVNEKQLKVEDANSAKDEKDVKDLASPTADGTVQMLGDFKPPNVLVYADSLVAKEDVKSVLQAMVNREKYIVYDLPTTPSEPIWNNSTVLVIVCGSVPTNVTSHLLQYLVNGGQLLCLCSDFLYSVLHTFTTAEVREHELVRFTYGQWKQVQMMHHIFCYQASPAKKQFSKDSDHSNPSSGNGSSPIAPRMPSTVEIQHNGKDYQIQVQVLGTEETWQTPSLLLATVKGSKGRAIFSQVHLEINPTQYEDDENKYEALKNSDNARLEILKDILANHLDIDCNSSGNISYTTAYFLGRHDLKLKMLSECESIVNNKLVCDKVTVHFCGKDVKVEAASSSFLPVSIHSCPANFSTVNYFETLETQHIGRLVLYSDVLNSSQYIINKTLTHGIVVIPRQQTNGVGRSSNCWISPVGSAMFSLQLHISLDTPLGRALPLVQQLVMVAIVSAVKSLKGCENLNIGIKWPNDLYANRSVKIGGLIANSTINSSIAVINIGCGINLDNSNPTTCINDLIKTFNTQNKCNIEMISFETYFATVFNEIEKLLNIVQDNNLNYFYDLYYSHWMHGDSIISICTKEGKIRKVKVCGIDQYGYLRVCSEDGTESNVQPDGNTFDMLKGLIAPKIF